MVANLRGVSFLSYLQILNLPAPNTQAYSATASVTKKKSFSKFETGFRHWLFLLEWVRRQR